MKQTTQGTATLSESKLNHINRMLEEILSTLKEVNKSIDTLLKELKKQTKERVTTCKTTQPQPQLQQNQKNC